MKELLKSKKFQAAVVGLVVAILSHFGLDVDNATVMTILSPILAFILGQGIADAGKEAMKIEKP